jgi:hypothetical protein
MTGETHVLAVALPGRVIDRPGQQRDAVRSEEVIHGLRVITDPDRHRARRDPTRH